MKGILLILLLCFSFFSYGQTPDVLKEYRQVTQTPNLRVNRSSAMMPPSNDNCSGAITLTVNGSCYNDSTAGATVQAGENLMPCGTTNFTETVWYRFVATSTTMWVQLNLIRFSGSGVTWGPASWRCAVYRSNTCLPTTPVSCQSSNSVGNGDGIIVNNLTGLVVGAIYYVQVGYRTGGGVNLTPTYCIRIGDQFTPVCNTCTNPCGLACGFTTSPPVSQVVGTCPPYNQLPFIEGATPDTQCYTFYAVNTTVSFGVIVNSTCQNGNVANFSWNLYNSSCGTPVQTGTLSNLTFNGLTVGMTYRFCYSFSTPSDCYHTAYYPYFVGASPLPIELLYFTASKIDGYVLLEWSTSSETNNDRFEIFKSHDGINYEMLGSLHGNGNSSIQIDYRYTDDGLCDDVVYYKLRQVDYDGLSKTYDAVSLKCDGEKDEYLLFDVLGRRVDSDYEGFILRQKQYR